MTQSMAIYSKPGTLQFFQISGPASTLHVRDIFSFDGFVFAPFDRGAELVYGIPGRPEEIDLRNSHEPDSWDIRERSVKETSRTSYQSMYEEALKFINSGQSEKIVVSARAIDTSENPSIFNFLMDLRAAYPLAFVYAFYVPGKEFWVGATPELLWETTPEFHRTVALAGTLRHGQQLETWGEKERLEHRYVEWFVEEQLGDIPYQASGPEPIKAGPVYHLKTEYRIPLTHIDINPVDFHPGPALSGYPVPSAVEWIRRMEHEPRRYYTGFLGPVSQPARCALYINLRCVELLGSGNVFYAGGGLTKDSDPDREWKEIQDKLSTLRSKIKDQEKV